MHQASVNQRELLKGTLGTIILQLLEEHHRLYGYEMAQLVKIRTGGKVLIREGSLYPALHKLQADGYIRSEEEYTGRRVRKYYRLTEPGKSMAQVSIRELMGFLRTIQDLVNPPYYVPA